MQRATLGEDGVAGVVRVYDEAGRLVSEKTVAGAVTVTLRPGGFAILSS